MFIELHIKGVPVCIKVDEIVMWNMLSGSCYMTLSNGGSFAVDESYGTVSTMIDHAVRGIHDRRVK